MIFAARQLLYASIYSGEMQLLCGYFPQCMLLSNNLLFPLMYKIKYGNIESLKGVVACGEAAGSVTNVNGKPPATAVLPFTQNFFK